MMDRSYERCYGEYFHSHPIFSVKENALQIFGYYDDLELANPLGSKSKIRKIGTCYINMFV